MKDCILFGANSSVFAVGLKKTYQQLEVEINYMEMEGVLTFKPSAPMKELPRLLKDVVPSLNSFISKHPPFNIGNSMRLTVPDEVAKLFPDVDTLFKLYSGKKGHRKIVEHFSTEPEDLNRDTVTTDVVPENVEKEYYFENVSVRNDLMKEANALLSTLFESEVGGWVVHSRFE